MRDADGPSYATVVEQDKASKRAPAGPPRGRRDDLGRAVLFMISAAVLLPTLNAGAKHLSARYPVVEITFFRYAGHFLYMLIAFAPVHGRRLLVSSRPSCRWRHLKRRRVVIS